MHPVATTTLLGLPYTGYVRETIWMDEWMDGDGFWETMVSFSFLLLNTYFRTKQKPNRTNRQTKLQTAVTTTTKVWVRVTEKLASKAAHSIIYLCVRHYHALST